MSAFATIFAQVSASMPDSLTEAVADSIDTVSEAVATVVNDNPAI